MVAMARRMRCRGTGSIHHRIFDLRSPDEQGAADGGCPEHHDGLDRTFSRSGAFDDRIHQHPRGNDEQQLPGQIEAACPPLHDSTAQCQKRTSAPMGRFIEDAAPPPLVHQQTAQCRPVAT